MNRLVQLAEPAAKPVVHSAASPDDAQSIVIRKARLQDTPSLLALINGYAAQQIMLPRTEFEMAENIRDFTVALKDGCLAGCGALHIYTPSSAEIRSLAVDPEWKKLGLGRRIMQALESEACDYGLQSLFAFTYVPGFFRRLGYSEVDRGSLPLKAWKDCLRCPKFQCCDEIAMVKRLTGTPDVGGGTPSNEGDRARGTI